MIVNNLRNKRVKKRKKLKGFQKIFGEGDDDDEREREEERSKK